MLIIILGNLGSGKTLLLTYLATKTKRKIFANYEIYLKNYNKLEVDTLLNLPNNIDVYLDEAYTWLESRVSGKALNRYLSYILLQSRKRTLDIYCTAQLFSTLDKRFREKADILIKCEKKNLGYKYWIYNMNQYTQKILLLPFEKAEKYYKVYDTYEIVEPYQKSSLEFTLLQSNTERLFKRAKEIAEFIWKDIEGQKYGITHNSVKLALLKNGIFKGYEPFVYTILKGY